MSFEPICANGRVLGYPLTGVQRYTSELLARLGDCVAVYMPSTPMASVRGHLWEQAVLPRHVGRNLLWSPSNTGPLAVRRQVVTIHDVVPLDHPEWLNRRFAAWYRFLIPRLTSRVEGVIAISQFTKRRLLETCKIAERNIAVIPNGVDQRFFPQDDEQIAAMRQELKLPGPHYVLALGSIEPRKNIPRLLEAWRRIVGDLSRDIWLVVAGGEGAAHIFRPQNLGRLPERVVFAGRVRDELIPALYSGAMLFVYPSTYEGFGLPPLEAMACGCAVLTGNRTALPEVVGDAGMTVDPFDVDALAGAIQCLIGDDDRRGDHARRGLDRAKLFSWDRTALETGNYLRECAEGIRRSQKI